LEAVCGPDADPAVLQSRGPDGRGLRITFVWQEDRYGHEIAYIEGENTSTLFVTEPGSARAPWPNSPPLQQINWLETVPGQRVGLLVGMAGKSHWSLSVQADRHAIGLTLDVACRIQSRPDWLGSTYRSRHVARGQSPCEARFRAGNSMGTILTDSLGDNAPATVDVSDTRLSIVPGLDKIDAPVTVRWKYRFRIDPGPDRET